jgi:hypothetical protein
MKSSNFGKALPFSKYVAITEGWIYTDFADDLHDFEFEREFAKFLGDYEAEWARLQRDYNWNRESRKMHGGHFAIDAKIHEWPELEDIKSEIGVEIDEQDLAEYFSEFMQDTRDQFTGDITEQYDWIKSISWGGRSGGWLVVWPEYNEEDFEDEPNYHLNRYSEEKLHINQEEILRMQQAESDPKFQKLIQLGLAEPPEQLGELSRDIDSLTEEMEGYLARMREYRAGLEEIAEMVKKFEKNAVENFKGWLIERF